MPKIKTTLNDDTMEQRKLPSGTYGFSATRLEELGATEYTLATIVVDASSSVAEFKDDMEACVREIVQACKFSPRADNLMIRLVQFDTELNEVHGYKLLEQCNLDDYNDCLAVGGMTALHDAAENAVDAATVYAKDLSDNDFAVNGIVVVITDGEDNSSKGYATTVKSALEKSTRSEALESLVSILVGVGTKQYPQLSDYLRDFKDAAGFTQYVEIDEANAKKLAKLAAFISKSISLQSQALGTGGPSKLSSLDI
jgi:hypothetical protein